MHRIADLRRRIADLTDRTGGLQQQIVSQQKAMRAVEQQVVGQMSSVVTLYQGSRRLGKLEESDLFDAVLDFFTPALQATKTALYVPVDGRWAAAGTRGWGQADAYPRSVRPGEGVVGRAALEKKPVSLRDWLVGSFETGAELPDRSDALMAAPLLDAEGEPVAVFAVQSMPFLRFNSASLNLMTLLAEWGAEAFAQCRSVAELKARSLLDEEFGVSSAAYVRSRLRQEFSRSARHALPLSLLLVAPAPLDALPKDRSLHYLRALARLLRERLRESDVIARSPVPEAFFAVILPTATREQGDEVRRRLGQWAEGIGLPAGMRVGLGSYAHTMKEAGEVLAQAREELL
ncbi:MAG: GAF domain-containing protein, partial [Elusimicrobia bacterium]|nr:GAF domain-containing protein [Elusimicrobiota bacterium]